MTEEHEDDRLNAVLHTLGERVRAMRLARGMSLTALSFEAELSEQRLRSIEAGRTAVPLAVLVALADVFEVGVSDLFGDAVAGPATSDAIDAPSASPHVVPSPVIWGGELPPAPWMTSAPSPAPDSAIAETPIARPPVAPPVVARPVMAPAAPVGGPTEPFPAAPTPFPAAPATMPAVERLPATGFSPHIAPGTEVLPPAPWQTPMRHAGHPATPPPPADSAAPVPPPHAPSVAPRVHQRAAERGMQNASAYVFVAPGAGSTTVPRTFADLRTGPLAGRNFRSLQEFAVASVVEGNHSIADVARVFRVPVWRLEQWVRETGHAV
ncbi:helix-turn-helix domain-containing protein [Microbacterium sp. B19]|uniref:helix-turn-helix domain-containing protein n=1 Tax=Microbacterium sp. B19 TaxID=96765 RepID=UPI0003462F96|nr:helix-turn-helix transcriptional regulator [Microbacterium sp. B19]